MNALLRLSLISYSALLVCSVTPCTQAQDASEVVAIPADIKAIFDKPFYHGAIWGLRVVDLDSGKLILNIQPERKFFVGSIRKVFTVGELMNEVGPAHRYNTPIYRQGFVDERGVLHGDLILVASGDLTMGGRTNPDGTIAYSDFDHNDANSLGNAILTATDPLAGYAALARQVAAAGIKKITGDVVIDDRLFKPYNFRGEFEMKPIFVNDDVVDLEIQPRREGELASLKHHPLSAALAVDNAVQMKGSGTETVIDPKLPECIGQPGCTATLHGDLAVGYVPLLTGRYPLIRTFRIVEPASYARTVLVEQLKMAGIRVEAASVESNPTHLLPEKNSYDDEMRVAQLQGLPYALDAKLILKVSYNMGADTSILLYGLTQGVNDMPSALAAEKMNLKANYGIDPTDYLFLDGSGGGDATSTNAAVTHMLADMHTRPVFPQYLAAFPILGVDGSLATVTDFAADPTLAGARGEVHAKTGTYLVGTSDNLLLVKGQAFGGYMDSKDGRKLAYELVVNNVLVKDINGVIQIFQDEGTISAVLWRDN